ncbi:uncharacterized protein LOC130657191 isoform X1 [Hydractinia symbiolongicarpus]|uniref:uncharacterized protein LOC130657191 isoform X1 n=1 Tax=Hydractinia symbiolongicarpus TaxID=13093 RepID=UPI00254FA8AA|nr:uncharacterized protein LOC130657191 isoform X1 [Hydractinia symbiolongicarpus]
MSSRREYQIPREKYFIKLLYNEKKVCVARVFINTKKILKLKVFFHNCIFYTYFGGKNGVLCGVVAKLWVSFSFILTEFFFHVEIFIHEMDYYIFDIFSQGESGESSSSLHRYPSYSEFHEALDSYEVKTKTHYTVLSETKDFNKDQCLQEVLEASSSPQICWQLTHKEDSLPIHFNGIPYIWLGTKNYQCHQGKDRGISIKKKYKQDREEKLRGDHPECVRTRKLAQHTKKLDCPVVFSVKKLLLFPGYKIEKDSKWNRTVASKKLKGALVKYHMKDDQLTIESRLQYITTFPTGTIFIFLHIPTYMFFLLDFVLSATCTTANFGTSASAYWIFTLFFFCLFYYYFLLLLFYFIYFFLSRDA